MARYIDLDKVDEHKNSYCNTISITHCNRDCVECFYNNSGAEDVAPVVHAKIIREKYTGIPICTNCKEICYTNVRYCYNCGAKLDKE